MVSRKFTVWHQEKPVSESNLPVSTGSGDDGTTTLLG